MNVMLIEVVGNVGVGQGIVNYLMRTKKDDQILKSNIAHFL